MTKSTHKENTKYRDTHRKRILTQSFCSKLGNTQKLTKMQNLNEQSFVRTVHVCVLIVVQLYTIQQTIILIISPILHSIVITQSLSIRRERANHHSHFCIHMHMRSPIICCFLKKFSRNQRVLWYSTCLRHTECHY